MKSIKHIAFSELILIARNKIYIEIQSCSKLSVVAVCKNYSCLQITLQFSDFHTEKAVSREEQKTRSRANKKNKNR